MKHNTERNNSFCGHRTIDALRILHDDIQSVLFDHERAMRARYVKTNHILLVLTIKYLLLFIPRTCRSMK